MKTKIDYCVGCPDEAKSCAGCVNAPREIEVCDGCHEAAPVWELDGEVYCDACLTEIIINYASENMDAAELLERIDPNNDLGVRWIGSK